MDLLHRNTSLLHSRTFDLVIVGGGIFGSAAAWEAASRGLSVALVEKADFSHATSANHFKMVHGGIRYLQHFDIPRVRESSHERSALLRIAPHLVHPLPIVIPTYGHALKGKEFLGAGMVAYDLITFDRNRGLQESRKIPRSRFLSRDAVLALFPGIPSQGLTGGALIHDGQMFSPPRLAISFLRSASGNGAVVSNYIEAVDFVRQGNTISGILAVDRISGESLQIRGKMVMIAAGPWSHRLFENGLGLEMKPVPTFSRDLAFVIPRKFKGPQAIAFSTVTKDSDTIVDRGGRHLFAVPWKEHTLIGVWHKVYRKPPDNIDVTAPELQAFIDEANTGFPGLGIRFEEVSVINTGLTLFGEEDQQGESVMSFGKRSLLIDHERQHGFKGLMSLIGVRATTARGMAEKAIDMVLRLLNKPFAASETSRLPISGGDFQAFESLYTSAAQSSPGRKVLRQLHDLLRHYGTQYHRVLECGSGNPELLQTIAGTNTLKAEVVHAVENEMAVHLDDVIFRRLAIGAAELPSDAAIEECADIMRSMLFWDEDRKQSEILRLKSLFPHLNFKFRSEVAS